MAESSTSITQLINQKRVLSVIKDALTKNITDPEILLRDFGLTQDELDWFIKDIAKENLEVVSRLIPLIDKELTKIRNKILEEYSKELSDYKIYLFAEWRDLIQARWPGAYMGKNVVSIEDSKVVLLAVKETKWTTITGVENMLILGPGIYYAKFYLEGYPSPMEYIRPIHGILMPTHIFESANTSPSRTYGKFASYYRKHLATILLDFYWSMPQSAKSLKRLYARIINENKSVFEAFMSIMRKSEMTPATENDLEFISLLQESYNRILTMPERIRRISQEVEKGIPGMLGFEGTLNKFKDLWRIVNILDILKMLNDAQRKFIKYGWEILLELTPR